MQKKLSKEREAKVGVCGGKEGGVRKNKGKGERKIRKWKVRGNEGWRNEVKWRGLGEIRGNESWRSEGKCGVV